MHVMDCFDVCQLSQMNSASLRIGVPFYTHDWFLLMKRINKSISSITGFNAPTLFFIGVATLKLFIMIHEWLFHLNRLHPSNVRRLDMTLPHCSYQYMQCKISIFYIKFCRYTWEKNDFYRLIIMRSSQTFFISAIT